MTPPPPPAEFSNPASLKSPRLACDDLRASTATDMAEEQPVCLEQVEEISESFTTSAAINSPQSGSPEAQPTESQPPPDIVNICRELIGDASAGQTFPVFTALQRALKHCQWDDLGALKQLEAIIKEFAFQTAIKAGFFVNKVVQAPAETTAPASEPEAGIITADDVILLTEDNVKEVIQDDRPSKRVYWRDEHGAHETKRENASRRGNNSIYELLEDDANGYILKTATTAVATATAADSEMNADFEGELSEKLSKYISELFHSTTTKAPKGQFAIHRQNDDNKHFWRIHIVGHEENFKNFSAAHWHSQWTVTLDPQDAERAVNVEGSLLVQVHYHEDGSVELAARKAFPPKTLKFQTATQAADKVYWCIRDHEDGLQVALNESYQQLSETTFKMLRRQLPITRTKMDWAKFTAYKLNRELSKQP